MESYNSKFLSIKEFASRLNLHANTVRRAILQGSVITIRIGMGKRATYRIPIGEIERFIVKGVEESKERNLKK